MTVSVHMNLTTKRFVVAVKPKGAQVGTYDCVTLTDVSFKVSEAQRQYCINKGGRWVHAWALGDLESTEAVDVSDMVEITYNPFRCADFHVSATGEAVHKVRRLVFVNAHCYAMAEDIL